MRHGLAVEALVLATTVACVPGTLEDDQLYHAGDMLIGPVIIFLNRGGGHYVAGDRDDPTTNVSWILDEARIADAVIPEYTGDDWEAVVDCVRDTFSPFNVSVTDSQPASASYLEAVVGGTGAEWGMWEPGGVAGVPGCDLAYRRAIVFASQQFGGGDARHLCWSVAQELAHTAGLEHEYLCEDPMTYLDGCGEKRFQDVDAPCGESAPRPCRCGETQNSFRLLQEIWGAAP
jgi:hypothetical protein